MEKNYLAALFFGPSDRKTFDAGLQQAIHTLYPEGIYASDNLFTFGRNLSFLGDAELIAAWEKHAETSAERGILWRIAVLAWAARHCAKLPGDFLECACYRGTSARILIDYVDFAKLGKRYYLYDMFNHAPGSRQLLDDHSDSLYDQVKARFAEFPSVVVTKGSVPQVLEEVCPEQVAFLHLDINNAGAELGALEKVFDRIVPGGIIVLDDYGWLGYGDQKAAEDPFFAERGYQVLELPTGQGLVFKR
ncbi:MAG: class I SAM-dependent methyltransferase [Burkholderiales bacterium]|nr:class I SAM-dependent methyltransferase [Burkholderiales bacterium]